MMRCVNAEHKMRARVIHCGIMTRVSRARILASWLAIAAVSCKGDEEGSAKVAIAGQEKISAQEDDLLKRRDALLATRLELRSKRAELAEKRKAIKAEGGDTSGVDEEAQKLLEEENDLVGQEQDLNAKLDAVLSERRAMVSALSTGGGVDVAGREAGVAAREKDLARREQRVAEREAALSSREESLASKWKDSCATGGTTTIVQTLDVKGSKYTKKDVEPLLDKAHAEMRQKGILKSDLPDPAQNLDNSATEAMAKGDYAQARFAASQLLATVRTMRIDKPFIAAKIGRLNAIMKGKSLSPQVEQLFREATEEVADGKFVSANKKLNSIYSKIN
jgi:hypothetical protein